MKYEIFDFAHKHILITGGAGFIGSNLALYLQEYYPSAKIFIFDKFRGEDRFSNGNLKSLGHFKNLIHFYGELIAGDISKREDLKVLDNYNFDYIFHQAAISDTTVEDQTSLVQTNVNSFKYFLDKAKNDKATFVYASSAASYGDVEAPQKVGIENPKNIYGFTKLMTDNIALSYIRDYPFMKIVGLRYFNVYGKREFYKGKTASMILQLALQLLDKKAPRLFYGSESFYRDFVYIKDVITANVRATKALESGVYNVGFGEARSFKDIVDILQKELGTSYEIEYFDNPYNKSSYQVNTKANISDSIKYLNYNPKFNLESGIKDYLKDIKALHKAL